MSIRQVRYQLSSKKRFRVAVSFSSCLPKISRVTVNLNLIKEIIFYQFSMARFRIYSAH